MNTINILLVLFAVTAFNSNQEKVQSSAGKAGEKQTYFKVQARRKTTTEYESFDTRTVETLLGYKPSKQPAKLSKYGGWLEKKDVATGFFHVKKIGSRWWGVDPDGYLYINSGLNSISMGGSERNKKAIIDKFGSSGNWMLQTVNMLLDNGFNCAGSWSSTQAIIEANKKNSKPFAYTINLNFMSSYGKQRGGTFQQPGHTGYPGDAIFAFDPEWETFCDNHAKEVAAYKNDPNLFGYFSDNEMPFRFKSLDNYIALPEKDPGHIAAAKWLGEQGITKEQITDKHREAFMAVVADRYFSPVAKALKKYDPNHMYIGARFYSSEKNYPMFMETAGKYLDIISNNYYGKWTPDSTDMANWTKWSGKPFIVTEYYTKGEDSGMPNTSGAGWIVKTQRDRGLFYQNYNLALLESKNCVGWHYFKYQDNDPTATGVDPSNTDSNKGIVNNFYEVWTPVMELMKEFNTQVYNIIQHFDLPIRPGNPEWPRAWVSYSVVDSLEKDFIDLKQHGVGLVSMNARTVEDARKKLALARKYGMKFHIQFNKINERRDLIQKMGLDPVDALMIGGIYKGMAIDRFLFAFTPGKQSIIVEPPVYNAYFAYRARQPENLPLEEREPNSHYYPDIPSPVKAEIVVPLKLYDGQQHLKIIPATIEELPVGTKLNEDSATPNMMKALEIKNRKLYKISFDLTGLDKAILDKVGVAVYWPFHGSDKWYIFGNGTVCTAAESTLEAARRDTQNQLKIWTEANGGTFPIDVVIASRIGDECFYLTGHLYEPNKTVNFPLWDYSQPAIDVYRKNAGENDYPRTWGYPEIYGIDAYGWWMYTLHQNSANLIKATVEEVEKLAPGILLFRNTTRAGIFAIANDHDGSGPELLTRQLNIVHLDPYPVGGAWWGGSGYRDDILRDMPYYAGLARRYNRLLIPWMQAHTYGGPTGLQHPSAEQVKRMGEEQYSNGVDALIWLGYGKSNTFPRTRPESWEQAGIFHRQLIDNPPAKPKAKLAVLRSYNAWSLTSYNAEMILNPQDWLLQQWLEVWSVKYRQPYDVFELPPSQSAEEILQLKNDLKKYDYVIATKTWEGAWIIGENTTGSAVKPDEAVNYQKQFESEIKDKGWIK